MYYTYVLDLYRYRGIIKRARKVRNQYFHIRYAISVLLRTGLDKTKTNKIMRLVTYNFT